jgi:hypothetical protein
MQSWEIVGDIFIRDEAVGKRRGSPVSEDLFLWRIKERVTFYVPPLKGKLMLFGDCMLNLVLCNVEDFADLFIRMLK